MADNSFDKVCHASPHSIEIGMISDTSKYAKKLNPFTLGYFVLLLSVMLSVKSVTILV